MPTRKIPEDGSPWDPPRHAQPCRHPEHGPPTMQVFELGLYEHE